MSSQNRVDPFQVRPESGLGGRWPIKWRPGTSVEGGTRFWPSGFRVYPILAIDLIFNLLLTSLPKLRTLEPAVSHMQVRKLIYTTACRTDLGDLH